jgi:hypothetical protein
VSERYACVGFRNTSKFRLTLATACFRRFFQIELAGAISLGSEREEEAAEATQEMSFWMEDQTHMFEAANELFQGFVGDFAGGHGGVDIAEPSRELVAR